jgi:hypothetical protein
MNSSLILQLLTLNIAYQEQHGVVDFRASASILNILLDPAKQISFLLWLDFEQ